VIKDLKPVLVIRHESINRDAETMSFSLREWFSILVQLPEGNSMLDSMLE